jgi:hypothetical protein
MISILLPKDEAERIALLLGEQIEEYRKRIKETVHLNTSNREIMM